MTASPKDDSVLGILGATLKLIKARSSELYGYAAWLLFPLLIFVVANASGSTGNMVLSAIGNAGFALLATWVTAATIITTAFYSVHTKHEADPRHVSTHAWKLVVPLLIVQILVGVLQFAGFLLFIVPGLIAMTFFAFSAQEVVLNNRRHFRALTASRELSRGRFMFVASRWFGIVLAFLLALFGVTTIILAIAGTAMGVDALSSLAEQPPLWLDMLLSVVQIALFPPLIVAQTLLYLTLEKE